MVDVRSEAWLVGFRDQRDMWESKDLELLVAGMLLLSDINSTSSMAEGRGARALAT